MEQDNLDTTPHNTRNKKQRRPVVYKGRNPTDPEEAGTSTMEQDYSLEIPTPSGESTVQDTPVEHLEDTPSDPKEADGEQEQDVESEIEAEDADDHQEDMGVQEGAEPYIERRDDPLPAEPRPKTAEPTIGDLFLFLQASSQSILKMDAKLDAHNQKMDTKLDAHNQKMDTKLDAHNQKINTNIQDLKANNQKMNAKMETNNQSIMAMRTELNVNMQQMEKRLENNISNSNLKLRGEIQSLREETQSFMDQSKKSLLEITGEIKTTLEKEISDLKDHTYNIKESLENNIENLKTQIVNETCTKLELAEYTTQVTKEIDHTHQEIKSEQEKLRRKEKLEIEQQMEREWDEHKTEVRKSHDNLINKVEKKLEQQEDQLSKNWEYKWEELEQVVRNKTTSEPKVIQVTCTGGNMDTEHKWPKYREPGNPQEFLNKLNMQIEKLNDKGLYKESKLGDVIGECMEGAALVWWRVIENNVTTYSQFKKEFLSKYWSRETQNDIRNRLERQHYAEQGAQSRVNYFMERVLTARNLTPPTDDDVIVEMLSQHFPREVDTQRVLRGIKTVAEMEKYLEEVDRVSRRSAIHYQLNQNIQEPQINRPRNQGNYRGNNFNPNHNANHNFRNNYNPNQNFRNPQGNYGRGGNQNRGYQQNYHNNQPRYDNYRDQERNRPPEIRRENQQPPTNRNENHRVNALILEQPHHQTIGSSSLQPNASTSAEN